MARYLGAAIGAVLMSGSIGCLLYTDPVNMPPTVSITAPTVLTRGARYTFFAIAQDESESTLKYDWGRSTGTCPIDHVTLPPGASLVRSDNNYVVELDDLRDACVFVRVTDEHGATATATVDVHATDIAPVAEITLKSLVTQAMMQGSVVPLYSELRYSSSGTYDPDSGDTVTLTWGLMAPDGTSSTPPACPDGSGDVCFAVDMPGMGYVLSLTAADPSNMTDTKQVKFDVASDQPPCIVETEPDSTVMGRIANPADTLTFTVTEVADDGDPLPPPPDRPSMGTFAWSWRLGGTGLFTRKTSVDLPTLTVPGGTYASGQQLEVRVEAHDRRPTQPEVLACDKDSVDQPLCPWPATSCSQWVTWTVTFQ